MDEKQFVIMSSPSSSGDSSDWAIISEILSPMLSEHQFSISDHMSIEELLEEELYLEEILDHPHIIHEDVNIDVDEHSIVSNQMDDNNFETEEIEEIAYFTSYQYIKPTLIRTPEFLLSLKRLNESMSQIAKDVANKCIQSSRITASKMKTISNNVREGCQEISSKRPESFNPYYLVHI